MCSDWRHGNKLKSGVALTSRLKYQSKDRTDRAGGNKAADTAAFDESNYFC